MTIETIDIKAVFANRIRRKIQKEERLLQLALRRQAERMRDIEMQEAALNHEAEMEMSLQMYEAGRGTI